MNPREIALKIINDVEINGAYANIALVREMSKYRLSDLDRRFLTELVYGVIKSFGTLDWLLSHFCTRPLAKTPPVIRNILRLGVYQLFFLDRVPSSAACNEAVKLAKKYGHPGTVKFVNAVLRSASRNPDLPVFPDPEKEPARYLALKYFHPEWMTARWVARYGREEAEAICQANNQTPPLSVRTNTLRINRDELLIRLADEGVSCEPSKYVPEGVVCHNFPALSTLNSLAEGLFQVQDESSMLVGHILAPRPGEFIIDACGAPGGKSTHIAALMNNTGRVLSIDLYSHKLAQTKENAERLGIAIIETKIQDAVTLCDVYPQQADRVLVDAPCSGLGVLRRKPDSRWRKTPDLLKDLPRLQSAILISAAQCVKPGGVLVYSTCTTEPEENQEIIKAFLNMNDSFYLENTGDYLPVRRKDEKMIQLWPHKDGMDGFFVARMRKF